MTSNEVDQIYTAIVAYNTEYGSLPSTSNNRELIQILGGKNPRNIEFINLRPRDLNTAGDAIDAWGTPIRISMANPEKLVVQSAGHDKTWDTVDDIRGEKHP